MTKLTQQQVATLFDNCVPLTFQDLANVVLGVNWPDANAWCDLDMGIWELEIHLGYQYRDLADEIGKVFTESTTAEGECMPFRRVSFILHDFCSFECENTEQT